MGFDEDFWTIIVHPLFTRKSTIFQDVSSIIVFLDDDVYQFKTNRQYPPSSEELEGFEKIKNRLMDELKIATTALTMLNAYERAYVFAQDLAECFPEVPKKTDDELNAKFEDIKTVAIVPFIPGCARDARLVAKMRDGSIIRASYTYTLIDNSKRGRMMKKST